ncbi:hypothetical protein CMUS01_03857 [Colletotrichum musicola]|uniref:Uncharacterized protein n=1 Tax=Colletotrichum musicola TaxID=2175873 RepID=A0A8H6NQ79_9PEZI|nr:hypothetical protein CMUS01_03857 [Colletotrichum musicola]
MNRTQINPRRDPETLESDRLAPRRSRDGRRAFRGAGTFRTRAAPGRPQCGPDGVDHVRPEDGVGSCGGPNHLRGHSAEAPSPGVSRACDAVILTYAFRLSVMTE